ncbi:MAG: hypothetical protein ACXWF8_05255 [Methylobacter sp.]
MSIKSRLKRLEQQEGNSGEFAVIHAKGGGDYEEVDAVTGKQRI